MSIKANIDSSAAAQPDRMLNERTHVQAVDYTLQNTNSTT